MSSLLSQLTGVVIVRRGITMLKKMTAAAALGVIVLVAVALAGTNEKGTAALPAIW